MNWDKLLSDERYKKKKAGTEVRNAFHKDYDRIVFSASFRRLARKTQVHPLTKNDHLHNRLTHSIEVGSVGRSLALNVYHKLKSNNSVQLPQNIEADHFASIVQAACMAHDIGNPPFGHAGEFAIREWFKENKNLLQYSDDKTKILSDKQVTDFTTFEGNAQGIRLLSKVENHYQEGGLRLTYATIAAIVKYPWFSKHRDAQKKGKFNFFDSESSFYNDVANKLGIEAIEHDEDGNPTRWCRHPLSYLMEAADDICNTIIDIEDAVEINRIPLKNAINIFRGICKEKETHNDHLTDNDLIKYRAKAIDKLVMYCADEFQNNYPGIMSGAYNGNLFETVKENYANSDNENKLVFQGLNDAKKITTSKIFNDRRKIELEVGSYSTIRVILSSLIPAIKEYVNNDCNINNITFKEKRLLNLLGDNLPSGSISFYDAYMLIIDFVSGMTDNYATFIAQQINGSAQ